MDTHKAKISVALAEAGRDREVRFLGEIVNLPSNAGSTSWPSVTDG
jgi:hypothetical protein